MKKILPTTFLCLTLISSVGFAGLSQGSQGSVNITLQKVKVVGENTALATNYRKECKNLYGQYLGEKVKNQYNITRQSQTDTATFDSQNVTLYPVGLSGTNSFLSDGVPSALSALGVQRVFFNIKNGFKHANGFVMFNDPINPQISCVLKGRNH